MSNFFEDIRLIKPGHPNFHSLVDTLDPTSEKFRKNPELARKLVAEALGIESPQHHAAQPFLPQVIDPQVIEPEVIEPQIIEPQIIEPKVIEPQDSGELTPGSRVSWASQVEDEHYATGWGGAPRSSSKERLNRGDAGMCPAEKPDDAAKKSKKKKKKSKANSVKVPISTSAVASSGSGEKTEERLSGQQSMESGPGLKTDGKATECTGMAHDTPVDGNAEIKGRNASESATSPVGRGKVSGSTSVWALKRSDSGPRVVEEKSGGPGGGKVPPPIWQSVESKDAARVAFANEISDNGWEVPPPAAASKQPTGGGWGAAISTQPEIDDSGWKVAGPRRTRGEAPATSMGAVSEEKSRDDQIPMESSASWDSGWEVAGSRRVKKGEETSMKSPRGSNLGQKGKGGGRGQQQFQTKSGEFAQRGFKQRSPGEADWAGRGGQDKGGRPSPRNSPAPSNLGAVRQIPANQMGGWGRPLNKANWETQPAQSVYNNDASSGASDSSTNILGKLLPQARATLEPNSGNGGTISVDSWKGGFPAFSGNGSSVFDDYPASLYSDSQCSDDDLDSDTMSVASFHSSDSYKSHTTQRMNKWFRNFFQELDLLTEAQLQEHDRQWHCPACQGGVGAIDWYRGLQPLLAHAKTVRSKRVKLHKLFAEVLEEEIRIRGAATGTHGSGKYGKWRGLADDNETKDSLIVWPPMVVVRNTQLEQDEDDKWIGMGNKELLDLFKKHNPVKARHAYGPQGHRGISVLIFAESPTGYYNAQRLDKQFSEAHRGKDNWDIPGKLLFQPGGDRILYVYMATPEDLEIFNKHSKGKQNLKWERKSLQEMVLSPMRKQDEENRRVSDLQGKVQKEMETTKKLKKTMSVITKKLSMREDEIEVIRNRAREQQHQQKIEMEDMETLYKEKIEQLQQEIGDRESTLKKVHEDYEQEHMQQCEELEQQASKIRKEKNLSDEQQQQQALVKEEIARHSQLVEMCMKNQEAWEARKVELQKEHHQKMMDFKSRQWEELIKFELKLEQERIEVMESFKLPTQKN